MATFLRLPELFLRLTPAIQFVIWFILILVVKIDTLLAPPVWDTAMGVFPPAIFLYENNFDLMQLIQLTGWRQGGPNVYSLSLWSWLIAVIMTTTQNPVTTYFIVHSLTFAICALAISHLVRTLALMGINTYLALLAGLLLFSVPLVSVQIGYMYTESPVMALSILAWVSWYHRRETLAVLITCVAISIKATGLIIGLCLLPLLLLRLLDKFSLKRLLLIIVIPSFYLFSSTLYSFLGGRDNSVEMPWGDLASILTSLQSRVVHALDVTYLIGIGLLAAILYTLLQWKRSGRLIPLSKLYRECVENGSACIAILFPFVFILGVLIRVYLGDFFLYRYLIPILPFTIITILLFAKSFRIQGVVAITLTAVCALFIYNHNGTLYRPTSIFSIEEHSHAYQGFVDAQKSVVEQISLLGNSTPIYVSREVNYMTSHPMMGYLSEIKPNIVGIFTEDFINIDTQNLPNEFYLVYSNRAHGGERIVALRETLADDINWNVERVFELYYHDTRMTIRRLYRSN